MIPCFWASHTHTSPHTHTHTHTRTHAHAQDHHTCTSSLFGLSAGFKAGKSCEALLFEGDHVWEHFLEWENGLKKGPRKQGPCGPFFLREQFWDHVPIQCLLKGSNKWVPLKKGFQKGSFLDVPLETSLNSPFLVKKHYSQNGQTCLTVYAPRSEGKYTAQISKRQIPYIFPYPKP